MSDDYTEYYNHCFIRCHEQRYLFFSQNILCRIQYTYYLDRVVKNVLIYYTAESQLLEYRGE